MESKVKLPKDVTSFDFICELPPEILEIVISYLTLTDTLIACYVSPLWNERFSSLEYYWKTMWTNLTINYFRKPLQPKGTWKEECERIVGRVLKLSEDELLCYLHEEQSGMKDCTPMHYSGNLLITFGTRTVISKNELGRGDHIPRQESIALLYEANSTIWELKRIIEFPPEKTEQRVLCCHLIPPTSTHQGQIVAGTVDGCLVIWEIKPVGTAPEFCTELIAVVQAHSGTVETVCSDAELGICVSAGNYDSIKIWKLSDGSCLKTFFYSGVRAARLLTGDLSPFIGYNCVLVAINDDIEYSAVIICWGKKIPLTQALKAQVVLNQYKYTECGIILMPKVFVEGGSLVYASEHNAYQCFCDEIDQMEKNTCFLIWKPIDPTDFIPPETTLPEEELDRFCKSLRPNRGEYYLPLPSHVVSLVAVGRCFAIVLTNNPPDVILVANDNGDTAKLASSMYEFNLFMENFTSGCTKWLDGLNFLQPESACFVQGLYDGRLQTWRWKKECDLFPNRKPSLSYILSLREAGSVGSLPVLQRRTLEIR